MSNGNNSTRPQQNNKRNIQAVLLETHVEKDSTTMGGRDLFQERFFFRKKEKEKEENAAINLREISKQQASNQRIDMTALSSAIVLNVCR